VVRDLLRNERARWRDECDSSAFQRSDSALELAPKVADFRFEILHLRFEIPDSTFDPAKAYAHLRSQGENFGAKLGHFGA
jgi:hypothetical protein